MESRDSTAFRCRDRGVPPWIWPSTNGIASRTYGPDHPEGGEAMLAVTPTGYLSKASQRSRDSGCGRRAARPTVVKTGIDRHGRGVGVRWAFQRFQDRMSRQREATMIAHVGDRLVLDRTHLDDARRVGVITGVCHDDGAPPYYVRWLEDGRITMIFPCAEARIEPWADETADPVGIDPSSLEVNPWRL
ncbi:MAG TPA: DUF1918 domain-containing protein [Actinoplanes sp.]|nr:DUF1918 domain-containing protein [Actinoplanes sp.]